MQDKASLRTGVIAGLIAGMSWGTVFIVPLILFDFSSLTISLTRFLIYGLLSVVLILPFARRIIPKVSFKQVTVLIKLVILGNIIYYILTVKAVHLIGVVPTSLIVGLVPLTAALFARRRGGVALKELAGPLTLIVIGIICLNTDVFTYLADVPLLMKAGGIACAVAALASWSWYAIENASYLQLNKDFTSSEWSLLFGVTTGLVAGVILLVMTVLPVEILPADISIDRVKVLLLVCAGAAFIPSFIGNMSWNKASQKLPISLTGQMIVFETIFALLYGFIYVGRLPRVLEVVAISFLIGGVIWAVRKHR